MQSLLTALTLVLISSALSAQSSARTATVFFTPGSPSQNGYAAASADVRYSFHSCGGELWIITGFDRSSVRTSSTYWYEGQSYSVPPASRGPELYEVHFAGDVVRPGAQVGRVSSNTGSAYSPDCYNARSFQTIASLSNLLGKDRTQQQVQQFLSQLSVPQPSLERLPALKNASVEQALGAQIRRATREEAQRKADAEKARRDAEEAAEKAAREKAESEARIKAQREAQAKAQRDALEAREKADRETKAKIAQMEREQQSENAKRDADTRQKKEQFDREMERKKRENEAVRQKQIEEDSKRNAERLVRQADEAWQTAEAAFRTKDFATARPLYQWLLGWPNYEARARQRLQEIEEINTQDAIKLADTFSRLTGLAVGLGISNGPFEADRGLYTLALSREIASFGSVFFDFILPGTKANFFGSSESTSTGSTPEEDEGTEQTRYGFTVGSTIPYLGIPFGSGRIGLHAGYTMQNTTERALNLGMIGASMSGTHGMLRLDATFLHGKPHYGFGVTINFGS
jgi:hypothetical protein